MHTVVPKWIDGNHNEYSNLSSAYFSALNVADVMGCTSIAFPLLASGNNGFDIDLALEVAQKSIETFDGNNLKKVILVIFGDQVSKIVKKHNIDILKIPKNILKDEKREERKAKISKIGKDGKEVAQKFLQDQIEKGLCWLNDKENREKLIELGIKVIQAIANTKNKK